jgi:hypothetical protein
MAWRLRPLARCCRRTAGHTQQGERCLMRHPLPWPAALVAGSSSYDNASAAVGYRSGRASGFARRLAHMPRRVCLIVILERGPLAVNLQPYFPTTCKFGSESMNELLTPHLRAMRTSP